MNTDETNKNTEIVIIEDPLTGNTITEGDIADLRASIGAVPFDEADIVGAKPFDPKVEVVEDTPAPVNYDTIEFEGAEARFYPQTGAIMVFSEEHNRWIIRANRGGRPDFDGKAMVAARELKKEQAIIDGLTKAALTLDMRFATTATGMLSAIVSARAQNAVTDAGRTGNADAKFIFSIINQNDDGEEQGPALRVDMDADTAADFIAAMRDMLSKEDTDEI